MEEVMEFIAKHSWLMNFKVTDFFVDRVWENAPPEWLDTMKAWSVDDLTEIPFGKQQKYWPESIRDFISSCLQYSIPRETDDVKIQSLVSSSPKREGNDSDQHKKDKKCEQNLEFMNSAFSSSEQNSLTCPDGEHVPPTLITRDSFCGSERDTDSKGKLADFSKLKHEPLPQKSDVSFCASKREIDTEGKSATSSGHKHALPTQKSGSLFGVSESEIDPSIRKGMTTKKLHEVRNMSALINAVACKSGADCVVDVGSGLGYLGQVLHSIFHHNVLGLRENKVTQVEQKEEQCRKTQESEAEFLHVLSHWLCTLPPDGSQVCSCKSDTKSTSPDVMKATQKTGTDCHQSDITQYNSYQERYCDTCDENSTKNSSFMKEDEEQVYRNGNKNEVEAALDVYNNEIIHACDLIIHDPRTNALTCSSGNPSLQVNENSAEKNGSVPNKTMKDGSVTVRKVTVGLVTNKTEETGLVRNKTEKTGSVPDNTMKNGSVLDKTVKTCLVQKETEKTGSVSDKTLKNGSALNRTVRNNSVPNNGVKIGSTQNKNTQLPCIIPDICMVGLHCCGDLSPTMLKYFAKMDFIKSLCIVSCCYHRMEYNDNQFIFENFPLSLHLKHCISKAKLQYPAFHFTAFSMRLAAQETRARWKQQTKKDHEFHTRNVAYRGILEQCLRQGPYTLKKMSRKLIHKGDCETFETYVKIVSKHMNIPSTVSTEHHLKSFQDKMWELYLENESYFVYVEPITALQFLLQPVLETLIYKDRQLWLEEQGFHGTIIPVFDEVISPRNLALIASK